VIFTEEAQFTRYGIQNFHNQHLWADENPHVILLSHHQQSFSIHIRPGICGDNLFGPHLLPYRLTGQNYKFFLGNNMPEYLADVPLIIRQELHFMHDGVPAHLSLVARKYLNRKFTGWWMGRGGPIAWPPHSPQINPLDFYLWGHLKVPTLADRGCRVVSAMNPHGR
jgi:hypothetical protein